jgi:hypothetical protein
MRRRRVCRLNAFHDEEIPDDAANRRLLGPWF